MSTDPSPKRNHTNSGEGLPTHLSTVAWASGGKWDVDHVGNSAANLRLAEIREAGHLDRKTENRP